MTRKCRLRIKCYFQYIKVISLRQHCPIKCSRGDCMGIHFRWLGDYHSLNLTRSELYSPKVTSLINLAENTVQRLCNCNSNARGCHNSFQSGVIDVSVKSIPRTRKKDTYFAGGTISSPKWWFTTFPTLRLPVCTVKHPSQRSVIDSRETVTALTAQKFRTTNTHGAKAALMAIW